MFRRALRIVTACGVLTAGYFGYCRGFAVAQRWIGTPQMIPIVPRDPNPSRTARETAALARAAFGSNHWTADPKQATWYYDAERGYWMFFRTYDKTQESRRIEFSPFALIWRSKSKANLNTVLANKAWVDFDKPFDLSKPGSEAARVVHAVIEGEVRLRDDKGTHADPVDDLTIGPLTHLEYDEKDQEIRSSSFVEMREGDLVARATGLKIGLRSKPSTNPGQPGGFSGAETIWLLEKITINVADVGKSGIVPGGSKAVSSAEPRPGELTADGPARIDLPKPRPKDAPPAPADPVIAQFYRNVVLRQGGPEQPDQINADILRLTLVPSDEATSTEATATTPADPSLAQATPAGADAPPANGGPLSGLTLQVAEATGHAVWLQSPSQGLKARGNQLIYERRAPEQADRVYFRGDNETWVERVSVATTTGSEGGAIQSVDTIRTKDVTIYQARGEDEPPSVIARGPGSMESRPDRGAPIARSAEWTDRLVMQTVTTAVGSRRRVTLTGTPRLISPSQGTLVAQDKIVAYLKPSEESPKATRETDPTTPPDDAPGLTPASDAFQIDWVEASGGVQMSAVPPDPATPDAPPPGAREILARKRLNVVFAAAVESESAASTSPGEAPPAVSLQPRIVDAPATSAPAPAPAPIVAVADAPADPPKQPTPAMKVEADDVWAKVAMGGVEAKPELQEVRLRGQVHVHQDPSEGKEKGLDMTAAAVDLQVRGEGRAWVEAHGDDQAPARAVTDTFSIEGPKLGIDQASDYAWVRGPGELIQEERPEAPAALQDTNMAQIDGQLVPTALQADAIARRPETGSGRSVAAPTEDPRRKLLSVGRGRISIRWSSGMEFYGQPPDSPDYAYARFLGDVRAVNDEASLACQKMTAVLDGPVSFRRSIRIPGDPATPEDSTSDAESEMAPERSRRITSVYCVEDVELIHRQRDEATGRLNQKGRIIGPNMKYNLVTGRFLVDGAGTAWLYKAPSAEPANAPGSNTNGRANPAAPGSANPRPPDPRASAGRPATVRTSSQPAGSNPNSTQATRFKPTPDGRKPIPPSGPMELTRITFQKRVEGRFLADDANDNPNTPMLATFLGGVQVLHAGVKDEETDASPDSPPPGFFFVSSNKLDVVREAPAPGGGDDTPEQFFIDASEGRPAATSLPWSIAGNRITYDSLKDLVYAYGDESGVQIANQDRPGQPVSYTTSRAVMFNRKTQQVQFIDPKNVLLIDPRSGIRAVPGPSAPPGGRVNKPRNNNVNHAFPSIPQGDKERKGYNGR